MKNHIKHVHDKIKEHICEVCAKGFATTSDLKTHRRTHTGEKNFPCHICGQSYSTKQYLQIHTRQHTGETSLLWGMWKSICWSKCFEKSPETTPKQRAGCMWGMWKNIQGQEEPEEPHDGPQQWGIDDRRYSHRFWKKTLHKRLQAGCFEKGSRDWVISHCKTSEYCCDWLNL